MVRGNHRYLLTMSITDSNNSEEKRGTDRVDLNLKAIVQIKDGPDETFKEVTQITTVSRNGAGFSLSRPCPIGRLVTIVLPMPEEYRVYDKGEELYPVLGVVQNCYKSMSKGTEVFHYGVAFIGKSIPDSFKSDPTQNYRIEGMREDGMWRVVEAGTQFKTRKHQRIWERIEVTITLLDQRTKTALKEVTFTQNVGAKGTAVESKLNAKIGDKIKFQCKELDFFSLAVVRNRKENKNKPTTLHLEFTDGLLPIEKVIARQYTAPSGETFAEPASAALVEPASREYSDTHAGAFADPTTGEFEETSFDPTPEPEIVETEPDAPSFLEGETSTEFEFERF